MANLTGPTNSLTNNIMAQSKQPMPEVGMGATELCYTDRKACTIVEVINDKTIVVQRDTAKRIDSNGMSECQQYEYSPDPTAARSTVTLRRNGRWVLQGESAKNGRCYMVGERDHYHDYSF